MLADVRRILIGAPLLSKRALLYRQRRTGKDRVIIDVPYHLQR